MTKVIFSFDDGRKDNMRVAREILEPMQIPATFNITTDYVEGIAGAEKPCDNPPMSKEEVIALSKCPLFEIAGHGEKHRNGSVNLLRGAEKLMEWCQLEKIGIASPNSGMDAKDVAFIKKNRSDCIKYIRLGDRLGKFALCKRMIRKLNSYLHLPILYGWIYRDTLLDDADDFVLYSVPVLNSTSVEELKHLLDLAIRKDKSVIFMFHSIQKKGEAYDHDTWTWEYDKLYGFCQHIRKLHAAGMIQNRTCMNWL